MRNSNDRATFLVYGSTTDPVKNFLRENNLRTISRTGFDNSTAWLVALRSWNLICKAPKVAFMNPRTLSVAYPYGTRPPNS